MNKNIIYSIFINSDETAGKIFFGTEKETKEYAEANPKFKVVDDYTVEEIRDYLSPIYGEKKCNDLTLIKAWLKNRMKFYIKRNKNEE